MKDFLKIIIVIIIHKKIIKQLIVKNGNKKFWKVIKLKQNVWTIFMNKIY